jgi:peptidoglycan/xylan/chitin deacetylase (PgdA/CDA1 family)
MPMWGAGLEDALLARDRVVVDDAIVEVGTLQDKRDAYARIAVAWDGPDAGAHYAFFCRQNGIDAAAVHRKHAISWDMLDALRNDPIVEIGSHTVSHARISSLSSKDAFAELNGSRERLKEKLGVAARHFAFPYGRSGDCGRRDFDVARQAGYASAATTRKGVIRTGQDAFSLPRNTLNGAHRNLTMIELHLTGATGAAAKVLGRV